MRSIVNRLISSFESRPDSEHRQAFVRLGATASMLICIFAAALLGSASELTWSVALPVLMVEIVVGLAILAHIVWRPAVSLPRRCLGLLSDAATLGILLSLGALTAPLYILVLGLPIDNGLRYGRRFLVAAAGLAAISFFGAILVSDYWLSSGALAWALLAGLLLIPASILPLLGSASAAGASPHKANSVEDRLATAVGNAFCGPLGAILDLSESLSTSGLDSSQRECVADLKVSARALQAMINEMANASATSSASVHSAPADFDLAGLMRCVERMMRPVASRRGLTLDIRVHDDCPRSLFGDVDGIRRILIYLVSHSTRSADRGRISVEVERHRSDEFRKISLRFSVRSGHLGLAQTTQDRVSPSLKLLGDEDLALLGQAGTGIAIARSIAEFLGGSIVFEVDADHGSQWRLDLDIELARTSSVAGKPGVAAGSDNVIAFSDPFVRHRARVASLDILIADDQPSTLSMLRQLLEKAGHRVWSVGGGEKVLTTLVERRFNVVIVDLHMPGVCGIETIQQARIMESGGDRTPIIVLSSDSNANAVHEAQRAGAHVYLTKPIMVPQLLDVIASVATWTPHAKQRPLRSGIDVFAEAQVSRQIIDELRDLRLGEKFIRDFIDECLNDSATCIDELGKCARAADWGLFRDHCHALKGVASNMGATRLAQSASTWMMCTNRELERNWKSSIGELGIDLEYARGAVRTLLDDGNREAEPERS
jgi:two-component system, sensor histidine kinase RpfC